MTRRSVRLLFLLTAIVASQGALAQASGDIATRLFARLDRDRNGVVTAREFAFMRSIDFRHLDRNNDGHLGRDEFIDKRSHGTALSARARRLRALRVRRFARIDGDRDGRITRLEYMAFGRRLYARLDRNGDGKLTLSEVRGSEVRGSEVRGSKVRGSRAGAAKSPKRRQAGGLFGQLDKNGDGAISLGELVAARRIVFRRLDTDGNGAISAAEFAAREAAIGAPGSPAPPPRFAVPARAGRRFLQLDRNADGRLTMREYLAGSSARFTVADRDGNGRLTRAEFEAGAGR